MIRPVKNLDKYYYECSNLTISIPKTTAPITILSDKVESIMIVKDYDNRILPYIAMRLHIPHNQYESILNHMYELTILFSIQKYKLTDNNIRLKTKCFGGTFKAINQHNIDPSIAGKLNQMKDSNNTNTQDLIDLNLFLYDTTKLYKMRKMNSIIANGTRNQILCNEFSRRGFNDVLMSPCSNTSTVFRVPYRTLSGAIEYINNSLGLYEAPYLFFMDYNTTYLINISKIGEDKRKLEIGTVSLYLEAYNSVEADEIGCFSDDKRIIVNMINVPLVEHIKSDMDYYEYGEMMAVISGGSTVVTKTIGNANIKRPAIANNQAIVNQEAYMVNEAKDIMSTSLIGIDIDILTPNKLYNVTADQQYSNYEIEGRYRLTKTIISLVKQGESGLQSTAVCTFKQQKK